MRQLFALSLCSLLLSIGCSTKRIPNTDLKDTSDNRQIVDFMVKYRQAVENRAAGDVLRLTSADYFEDNGTADQSDDYGIEHLTESLDENFSKLKDLKLSFFIQHVNYQKEKDEIHVIYRFVQRALMSVPAGDEWITTKDVNEIVLRPTDSDWSDFRVLRGL